MIKTEKYWEDEAGHMVRGEIKSSGLDYNILSEELLKMGVNKNPECLRLAIRRGKFPFKLFLQIQAASKRYKMKRAESYNVEH